MQYRSLIYLTLISFFVTQCANNEKEKKLQKEKQLLELENEDLQLNLQSSITEKNHTIEALEISLQQAKDKELQSEEEIRMAKAEAAKLATERNGLKGDLFAKEELLTSATTNEARLKVEIKNIEAKLLENQSRIASLDNLIMEMTSNDNNENIRSLSAELESEKTMRATLEKELAEFKNTMAITMEPFWGLYYSPSKFPLAGTNCRILAYADDKGIFTQAIVCDDGKIQWSSSRIQAFDAKIDRSLEGNYGLNAKTSAPLGSSCKADQQSGLDIGTSYTFSREATFGGAIFSANASLDFNGSKVVLDNASIQFKSNECEDLIARSASNNTGFNADQSTILQTAVQLCTIVADPTKVAAGCFTSADDFVKN